MGVSACQRFGDAVVGVDVPLAGVSDRPRGSELTSAVVLISTGGQCSSRTMPA